MNEFAGAIILGRVIAEQTQVKKIGRPGQKFERRKIAFIERTGVGPNPTDAILFQQPNNLGPMPASVTKFNGKPETSGQLHEKFSQNLSAILGCERGRQLDQHNLELRLERFDRAQKGVQFDGAIAQPADMGDFARKFATKAKGSRSEFDPAPDRVLRRYAVKSRINFNGEEIARIKFEPFGFGQVRRIKTSAPFREAPGAGADSNFLLVGQLQIERKSKLNRNAREAVDSCPPTDGLVRGRAIRGARTTAGSRAAQLDGVDKSITLPVPMKFRVLPVFLLVPLGLFLVQSTDAAVVFRPGEKAKYVAPGEEELNGNAAELFEIGQKAEKEGNPKRAIRAYRQLVRKYSRDALAAGAAFRGAVLYEQVHQYLEAAGTYRLVVTNYPTSPHFDEAIEGQFRVGEMYLAGKKLKLLGIPFATSMDRAVEIFAAVVRTAPYGKYTARAQFDIGLAREKQGANDAALQAYTAVVDKFPDDPVAADAQYQIGYIWFTASRHGTKDIAATSNARTAFQDFLFRYPNSEKAAQARANLQQLEHKATSSSFDVARYYDKQKAYRAAVIYYNEVIRQQPGSAESEKAKKRIDQLRAKLGDKVLQPLQEKEAEKKKSTDQGKTKSAGESTPAPNSASILPPDLDSALPPPPSNWGDTTAPPASSTEPGSKTTPESSPEDSGSSEATASPTP